MSVDTYRRVGLCWRVWALALALMKAARVMLLLRIALLLPLWGLSRPFLLFSAVPLLAQGTISLNPAIW